VNRFRDFDGVAETLAAPVALAAAGFLGSLLGASFVLLLGLIGAWIAVRGAWINWRGLVLAQ
jgi:hypothetical protein